MWHDADDNKSRIKSYKVARAESDARGRLAALRVWLPGCKALALHFERPAPRFHATPPPDARRPVPLLIGL